MMNIRKRILDESGSVLPIVAVFILFVAVGLSAIVVDGGVLYNQRRQMVTAADAGALSGAREMVLQSRDGTKSKAQIEALSVDAAKKAAIENGADDSDLDSILYIHADASSNNEYGFPYVEVKTTHVTELFFAKIFGINSSPVRARAVARSDKYLNPGIMPLFVVEGYAINKGVILHEKALNIDDTILHYSSQLLDLDGGGGGTNELQSLLNREVQLSQAIISRLGSGIADSEAGFKDFGPTLETWFQKARAFSADPNERKAYMTVFIPVVSKSVVEVKPNDPVTILEYAEFVIVDYFDSPIAPGLASAFEGSGNSSGVLTVDYSAVNGIGADRSVYNPNIPKTAAKFIVGYFTGKTISKSDILNNNYVGTIYDSMSTRRYFLVE